MSIFVDRNIGLGWIKWALKMLNIKGRTRYYTAFQDAYYYNEKNNLSTEGRNNWQLTTQQIEARQKAVAEILEQSDLKWWIHNYMKEVNIEKAALTIAPHIGNTLTVIVKLEGMQTN